MGLSWEGYDTKNYTKYSIRPGRTKLGAECILASEEHEVLLPACLRKNFGSELVEEDLVGKAAEDQSSKPFITDSSGRACRKL